MLLEKKLNKIKKVNPEQFKTINSFFEEKVEVKEAPINQKQFTQEDLSKAVGEVLESSGIKIKINTRLTEIENQFHQKANSFESTAITIIKAEIAKLAPIYIKIGNRPEVKFSGRKHSQFDTCLDLCNLEKQVFIAGPAGTGKTTLAGQVAKAFDLPFGHISCTLGMSEAHLLGRMSANGDYLTSQFVKLYENGGVFLFDEVDAADPNTMLIINSALANGNLSIPNRVKKPTANRHEDFYCICAANTWGHGSNQYVGRNVLDAAFLDRFTGSRMLVDYDKDLERELAGHYSQLLNIIWKIRENVKQSRIERVVSTRAIISGAKALAAGHLLPKYIDRFMTGWSNEEKSKALLNVSI